MSNHEIKLPDNLDIFHRVTYGSLSVKRNNNEVVASINWSAIGATDLETAAKFANSITYLTEHGNSIIAMIESGELQNMISAQLFTNGKSVFIPMEVDERGVLGFDIQTGDAEYITYGHLLYDYDERHDITTERERHKEDYEKQLAKHRKKKN